MTGKERYEHIEIPAQLTGVIDAQKKAARKRSIRLTRYSSVVACRCPAIRGQHPDGGQRLIQSSCGGHRSGSAVRGRRRADRRRYRGHGSFRRRIKIQFDQEGKSVSSVPAYTVDHRDAPNRLIFTFNGVRNFDYETLKKDMLALPLVKDVYENVILDDSAMRFVVELKDGVKHTVSEYKDPGYIELKLTSTGEPVTPREVFYIRSEAMPQGNPSPSLKRFIWKTT